MRSNAYKWISWLCLLVGLYFLFTLILIAVRGGEWNFLITVNNPKKRMVLVLLALAGWFFTRKGAAPFRDWKTTAGCVFLFCASMAFSLASAEVALRVMLDRNQGDGSIEKLASIRENRTIFLSSFHPLAAIVRLSRNKKLVYELFPNLDMEFGHRTLKTNHAGMRESRDYEVAKPADMLRIVGLGDSGMFGWNVDQDQDYLSVLEERLQQEGGGLRYEVLNLAVPGYNSYQELEMLRDRGLAFRPDVVIVGWCDNDFGLPFFMSQSVDYTRRDVSFLYHLLFNREVFQRLVEPPALRGSEINRDLVDPALVSYTGAEGVSKAFAELQEEGRKHGFKLLVFGPMNSHATRICEELGIDYFNTFEEIPKGKYPSDYAVHFMHPGPGGHRVLGEELHAWLKNKGWLSRR